MIGWSSIIHNVEISLFLQVDDLPLNGYSHSYHTDLLDSSASSFETSTSQVSYNSVTAPSISPFTSDLEFEVTDDEVETFRQSFETSLNPSIQSREFLLKLSTSEEQPSTLQQRRSTSQLQPSTSQQQESLLSLLSTAQVSTHGIVAASRKSGDTYGLMEDNLDTNIKS